MRQAFTSRCTILRFISSKRAESDIPHPLQHGGSRVGRTFREPFFEPRLEGLIHVRWPCLTVFQAVSGAWQSSGDR